MPPAGWMLDPEKSGQMRWWDGAGRTDMRKPIESKSRMRVVVGDLALEKD